MNYETLIVNADSGHYPIYVGDGLLKELSRFCPVSSKRRAILVTDSNVNIHYGEATQKILAEAGWDVGDVLVIAAGEESKCFKVLEDLIEDVLAQGIDRQAAVFALGGGVVGDLSGFLASMLLRGIDFVQLPTSLLAQVDSAVGGKTGINTPVGKNLVGAFYQPLAVVIDTGTLITLPEREFKAGYAEIIKYGMIYDVNFRDWLEENGQALLTGDADAILHAVLRSCEIKAEIVKHDEKETAGIRAFLNFGHTFGHALEYVAGYDDRLKHGEAVAIGMVMATKLSENMGLCPIGEAERLQQHLQGLNITVQPSFPVNVEDMLGAMHFDKKNKDGKIHFILLENIGKAVVRDDIHIDMVEEFLTETIKAWT